MARIILRNWPLSAALVWLLTWGTVQAWPASFWFQVHGMHVFDTPENEDVVMEVQREIHRPFLGQWAVLVRRWDGNNWIIICTADGVSDYRPDALLPDPLTLSWWTNGKCQTPDVGTYFMSTIWTISGSFLPDKRVSVQSNVFRVVNLSEESAK